MNQANGGGFFGQTSSTFGSGFGSNSQSNGFAPSTSSIFNSAPAQNGGGFFGTSQPSQPASQPATSGSFFSNFGSSQQGAAQNGTSGAQASTQNSTSTNAFSGFLSKQPENNTPSFSFGNQNAEASKPTTSNIFGAANQNGQQVPKPANGNIFGATSQANTPSTADSTQKTGSSLFGTPAPQPSTGNLFSLQNQSTQKDESASKPTEPTTNLFSSATPKASFPAGNIFGSAAKPPATTTETPKHAGSASIFGSIDASKPTERAGSPGLFGATASANTTPAPEAGASLFDSVRKVNKMPHNLFTSGQAAATTSTSSNMFSAMNATPQANGEKSTDSATASKTPAFAGFGQSTSEKPASLFSATPQADSQTPKPTSNIFGGSTSTAQPSTPSINFGGAAKDASTSNIFALGSSSKPSESSSAGTTETPKAAPPTNLFSHIGQTKTPSVSDSATAAATNYKSGSAFTGGFGTAQTPSTALKPAQPTFTFGSSTPSSAVPTSKVQANTSQPVTAPSSFQPLQEKVNTSTTPVFSAGSKSTTPAFGATPSATRTTSSATAPLSAAQKASFKHLNRAFTAKIQRQDPESDWTSLFNYYARQAAVIQKKPAPPDLTSAPASLTTETGKDSAARPNAVAGAQTPNFKSTSNLFNTAPSTAPPVRAQPTSNDGSTGLAVPATEKRSRPNDTAYPKLPANASSTSKLFAAALEKPKGSADTASASTAPAAPKAGGFVPKFTTGAAPTNFLAAFGQTAAKADQEAREKRRMDDYDSEEETPEEWEKRDKEEQAAKRAKIEEAAKQAKGFVLNATSTGDNASKSATTSLFSSVSKTTAPSFTTGTSTSAPAKPSGSENLFSFLSQKKPESTTPATPNLFSAGSSTSLFSAGGNSLTPAAATNLSGKSPLGATSGTSTPVTTTDAASGAADERSDDEGAEEPVEQAADMSALLPEEKENQEILFELPAERKSRAYAVEANKEGKKVPVSKGIGKPYILKSKITGRSRLLFKIETGKAVMNYDVVQGGKYGVNKKTTYGPFLDHIYSKEPKLTQFQLNFSSEDFANKLFKVLEEAAK